MLYSHRHHTLWKAELFLMPTHELVAYLGSLVSEIRSRSAVCTLSSHWGSVSVPHASACMDLISDVTTSHIFHSIFSLSDPHAREIESWHRFSTFSV